MTRSSRSCERCSQKFAAPSPHQRFCSRRCAGQARRKFNTVDKWCNGCKQQKVLGDFAVSNLRPDGRQTRCKACGVIARRTTQRSSDLLRRFGITAERYDAMLSDQEGRCAICGLEPEASFHVDHDHKTGQVRGLLCGLCNKGLGMFRDNAERLRSAARYLDECLALGLVDEVI